MQAIGYRKTAALLSASSVWGIEEQAKWKKDNLWPYVDPYYSSVVLLMPMTGANNSTTFTDVSPTPKTVTVVGNTKISTTQSKWGNGSGYFDGSGDYLSVAKTADFTFPGDFTVEFWFYTSQNNRQYATFLSTEPSQGEGWTILFNHGSISDGAIAIYSGAASRVQLTNTSGYNNSQFHHCAWSRSGTSEKLFLDGVLRSSSTSSVQHNCGGNLIIGSNVIYTPRDYLGYLQDLRITKGIARYIADFTPPTALVPQ